MTQNLCMLHLIKISRDLLGYKYNATHSAKQRSVFTTC